MPPTRPEGGILNSQFFLLNSRPSTRTEISDFGFADTNPEIASGETTQNSKLRTPPGLNGANSKFLPVLVRLFNIKNSKFKIQNSTHVG